MIHVIFKELQFQLAIINYQFKDFLLKHKHATCHDSDYMLNI
jgi:hypothetical protein